MRFQSDRCAFDSLFTDVTNVRNRILILITAALQSLRYQVLREDEGCVRKHLLFMLGTTAAGSGFPGRLYVAGPPNVKYKLAGYRAIM